jgi:large subunit ribosomal protein L32
MRRSHDALSATNWVEDQNTGEAKRRHHIDLKSGTYRGRQVITANTDAA